MRARSRRGEGGHARPGARRRRRVRGGGDHRRGRRRGAAGEEESAAPWEARWRWERDTDALYAAFVEQLFDYPIDQDVSWPNLQEVLRNADNNLLYNHLGLGEESADVARAGLRGPSLLPARVLRVELRLPFGFRDCSRGSEGVAPRCGAVRTTAIPRSASGTGEDEVHAFERFVTRVVAWGVHSATGRTLPSDSETDLYPVGLERASLAPGTVYADPYGHLMVLSRWVPQTLGAYGVLLAVDAQPDGTVGRRRFWRGNFLFTPSTTDVGAGFKGYRPLVRYEERGGRALLALDNEALATTSEHARSSDQQYRGSADDFYDAMEALINPRPLEAEPLLVSLVDALEEAVVRRVTAVANGEEYMAQPGSYPMAMPSGYDVFETDGPWEDYATPSRDMRLLIALDTVLAFPAQVRRAPGALRDRARRAGPRRGRARGAAARGAARGGASRTCDRTARARRLTLADVRDRQVALEVGYDPNDCIELRWGASEGSPERASCARRAPEEQRAKMERYRAWFHDRRRPPR